MLLRSKRPRDATSLCTCLQRYSSSSSAAAPSDAPPPPSNSPISLIDKTARKSDWKRRQEGSNFVDTLSLYIHSGRGGSGGVAFHREKFLAKGPPSGGPGGAGGSVYLLATSSLTSLAHLPRTVRAGGGLPGGGKWLAGKRGEDMYLRVPVGTIVREVREETEGEAEIEREEREELEWAWEASKVRLAEAEKREKRWNAWKKAKDAAAKSGAEDLGPFDELDLIDVGEHKQAALERLRKNLFSMYPNADLASHPHFLNAEHLLLSKLLSRQAALPGKKTRRRRVRVHDPEPPLHLDLTKPTPNSEPVLLLTGGPPGLGNASFQSTEDRSPKYATKGGDGDMMRLELELKSGGDVGLIGMPNAGKSTILRALTSSTPRVASYAFTTLNPHHGTCVVYYDSTFSGPRPGLSISDSPSFPLTFSATSPRPPPTSSSPDSPSRTRTEALRFTLTDNPGLVSHSSLNVGLGHAFLRHIERCSALVYVIDLSAPKPLEALETVRTELREYERLKGLDAGELEGRVRGVVANKADLFGPARADVVPEEDAEEERRQEQEEGVRKLAELKAHVAEMERSEVEQGWRSAEDGIWVVPVSAKRRENVAALVKALAETVGKERKRVKELLDEEERWEEEERRLAKERQVARRDEW